MDFVLLSNTAFKISDMEINSNSKFLFATFSFFALNLCTFRFVFLILNKVHVVHGAGLF